MKFEIKIHTDILGHTISGDFDTRDGWEATLNSVKQDENETVEDSILSPIDITEGNDGLIYVSQEDLAQKCFEAANKRGEWQPDSYRTGRQIEIDDGIDTATGIHRVHLEDETLLAYCDFLDLEDLCPNHSCNAETKYKVTVVFSKNQEEYAKNQDGELIEEDLDWEKPSIVIVEEL